MLSGATFYDCINTMYQFIKTFLDNKMSIFEGYGAFKIDIPYFKRETFRIISWTVSSDNVVKESNSRISDF